MLTQLSSERHAQLSVMTTPAGMTRRQIVAVARAGINLMDGIQASDLKGLAGAFHKVKQDPNMDSNNPDHIVQSCVPLCPSCFILIAEIVMLSIKCCSPA